MVPLTCVATNQSAGRPECGLGRTDAAATTWIVREAHDSETKPPRPTKRPRCPRGVAATRLITNTAIDQRFERREARMVALPPRRLAVGLPEVVLPAGIGSFAERERPNTQERHLALEVLDFGCDGSPGKHPDVRRVQPTGRAREDADVVRDELAPVWLLKCAQRRAGVVRAAASPRTRRRPRTIRLAAAAAPRT